MLSKAKARRLRNLSRKKARDEEKLFIAEGPKVVDELFKADSVQAVEIFATEQWLEANDRIVQQQRTASVTPVGESELKQISSLAAPNQVLAVFRQPTFPATVEFQNRITLMLDTIQDPGNLGTIIRCADWFGIHTVVCSPKCVDAYNPKVVMSTMGSIARVQVIYRDLHQVLDEHANIPVYAAALEGENLLWAAPVEEGFLIIGNESRGINPELLSRATHKLTIPRKGKAESLNAAMAAGILLSHLTATDL